MARRFDKNDFATIAEYICDEYGRRKRAREDREKQWKDIDRQVAMEPDVRFKKDGNGKPDSRKVWMSEMELPLQAETLEVLTSDARRLMFPDTGSPFRAHVALTDDYLQRIDFNAIIAGDQNEVPSRMTQDDADKLVEGWLNHLHAQYDFPAHIDLINAEAFKYGVGIGRARNVTKQVLMQSAQGTIKQSLSFPVLFPRSIRNTYLDDRPFNLMNEGYVTGPSVIHVETKNVDDVKLAASKGSNNPDDENGGWMPANVKNLEGDKDNAIEILEYEGDLIVPRKTVRSIIIPGAIVTVAKGKSTEQVIRFRFRTYPFPTYLVFNYNAEDVECAYASGPLVKGRPIQMAATQALNRLMDAAALKNNPPIGYDPSDPAFATRGGPCIEPYATWPTNSGIQVYEVGDPVALAQVYQGLITQFADLTGVNAPRLGRQTVSHTTAYAKNAELQRGAARTIDYVNAIQRGPLTQWLYMAFAMSKASLKGTQPLYLPAYKGWVEIKKQHLPDLVNFEWFGNAGPADDQAREERRFQAALMAIQLDNMNVQTGGQRQLNIPAMIEEVLHNGGWPDVQPFLLGANAVPPGVTGAPAVAPFAAGNLAAQGAPLQTVAGDLTGAGG